MSSSPPPTPVPPPYVDPHPESIQEERFTPRKAIPSKLTVVHGTTANSRFGTARPSKRDWMDRVAVQRLRDQDLQEIGDSQFPDQGIIFNIDGYPVDRLLDSGKDPPSRNCGGQIRRKLRQISETHGASSKRVQHSRASFFSLQEGEGQCRNTLAHSTSQYDHNDHTLTRNVRGWLLPCFTPPKALPLKWEKT
ncbi:hypothetical protein BT96DRAFT_946612 [Gymnopus androsaceus JB14]|uniref:Uncharacterized protein n=1 Tax=Gymnopus androsaceus JB14 TaxID=1447944 RepID=A0A6A4GWF5_9AGAR|nr:hypothetical protein BT96DRAFT_946612 [Gymnopus androsaceus JB14]